MMPALGELARDIEPVCRDRLARPVDGEARGRERVERGVVARRVARRLFHPRDQHWWTQPAIDRHAFGVQPVDERDEVAVSRSPAAATTCNRRARTTACATVCQAGARREAVRAA